MTPAAGATLAAGGERKEAMMEAVGQAELLVKHISKSLKALRVDWPTIDMDEPEVRFRFRAVDGILIIALNDANQLVKEWQKEEC